MEVSDVFKKRGTGAGVSFKENVPETKLVLVIFALSQEKTFN